MREPQSQAEPHRPTVTRSKTLDRVVFAAALLLLVLGSFRLIVYAHVTPIFVSVAGVTAMGQKVPLATPLRFNGVGSDRKGLEETIRSYSKTPDGLRFAGSYRQLEWKLLYSVDSIRFDKTYLFTTP